MIVEEIMNTNVSTLSPNHTIEDAIKIMNDKKIRHLPIIDSMEKLVGIITDRDIKDATPSIFHFEEHKALLSRPLGSIMSKNIMTGHPLDFVEEIAALFYEHHISCLPIVNENKLVGIVTETDMLHTLVELTCAHKPGSQIEVRIPNKTGMLNEIATIIKNKKANIHSILVYPDKKDEDYSILVLRVETINPVQLIEEIKRSGHHVLWPNIPGITK